jgi:hypothetical protein
LVNRYGEITYDVDTLSTPSDMVNGQEIRIGTEYLVSDWLALRGGYRDEVQSFVPAGASLTDEPVHGSVFTVGFGVEIGSIRIDCAYQYMRLKYYDAWMSNTNYNSKYVHTISLETGYIF